MTAEHARETDVLAPSGRGKPQNAASLGRPKMRASMHPCRWLNRAPPKGRPKTPHAEGGNRGSDHSRRVQSAFERNMWSFLVVFYDKNVFLHA